MKNVSIFLLTLMSVLFAACDDAGYEYHQTFFYPQGAGGMQLYADQTYDTTHVYSIDEWVLEKNGDWFQVSPLQAGKIQNKRIDLTTTANTTGKNRWGLISVVSFEKVSMQVFQTSWLNIQVPFPRYTNESLYEDRKAIFEAGVDDDEHKTKIMFHVYQDGATLVSLNDWLVPEQTNFKAGSYEVVVNVAKNPDEIERKGGLVLTSGGVSSKMEFVQAKQVDEEANKK